jgi:hypothetical protein
LPEREDNAEQEREMRGNTVLLNDVCIALNECVLKYGQLKRVMMNSSDGTIEET